MGGAMSGAMSGFVVRPYREVDEQGWVRCRVLSFLNSAFFDDVRREKEHYDGHSIELVADDGDEIVGLLDVECEEEPGTVCSSRPGLGGMIWHVAVHPDRQRRGIGTALLSEAGRLAAERGLVRFEAWTRDDEHVQAWYESRGFEQVDSYLHVYVELGEGLRELFPVADGLRPVKLFAHYIGERREEVKERFARVHECVLYERRLPTNAAQRSER
jgi:ribosomal protein S18 acetylase RimI-like enzyme